MHSFTIASFAAGLLIVFVAGDEAALKKDKAAFQGVWKVTSLETPKGKDANAEGATLEFNKDGKNFTFMHNDETKRGTFKLNPAGKPKEIDVVFIGEDKTFEGIYQIEKNKLKICICLEGNAGPAAYGLNDMAAVTVLVVREGKVVSNFAYADPNGTVAREIIMATKKALDKK